MAKIDIAARTPGIFNTNRRKCGWGAALTTCDICGKIMVGHNRGTCSKCMRAGRRHGDTVYTAHSPVFRFSTSGAAENRTQAKTLRDTYASGGTK